MTKIGYARVSSKEQNLDRQINQLKKAGCRKIFTDKSSGAYINRDGLDQLINYIRDDDVIIVSELDRLSRNSDHLTKIMHEIQNKGSTLEILNLPSMRGIEDKNLRNLLNNIIIELYKYQAESERKAIRERQEQGIAIAKREGKYKGRKAKYNENSPQIKLAIELYNSGDSIRSAAKKVGMNYETLRRHFKKYKIT